MGTPRLSLVLGTTNPHKQREFRALLAGVEVELLLPQGLGEPPDIEETGATFAENARQKALGLADWCAEKVPEKGPGTLPSGYPVPFPPLVLAEDSGLEVEALNGAPGLKSSRFAGPQATDADRNARLLELLAGVPPERRSAQYTSAICLAQPGRVLIEVQGHLRGRIALAPAGAAGFGYDPVFIPEGYDRTIGQLGEALKHRISHRARAVAALLGRLDELPFS